MRTPGKCVCVNSASGVQIPLYPPVFKAFVRRTNAFFMAFIGCVAGFLISKLKAKNTVMFSVFVRACRHCGHPSSIQKFCKGLILEKQILLNVSAMILH